MKNFNRKKVEKFVKECQDDAEKYEKKLKKLSYISATKGGDAARKKARGGCFILPFILVLTIILFLFIACGDDEKSKSKEVPDKPIKEAKPP